MGIGDNMDNIINIKYEVFVCNGDMTNNDLEESKKYIIQGSHVKNLITNVGKQRILDLYGGLSSTAMTYIAVGTSDDAAVATQTALQGVELDRDTATITRTSYTLTLKTVFTAGSATGTWKETGLFDAATAGNMGNRAVYSTPIVKGAGDIYTAFWTITYV